MASNWWSVRRRLAPHASGATTIALRGATSESSCRACALGSSAGLGRGVAMCSRRAELSTLDIQKRVPVGRALVPVPGLASARVAAVRDTRPLPHAQHFRRRPHPGPCMKPSRGRTSEAASERATAFGGHNSGSAQSDSDHHAGLIYLSRSTLTKRPASSSSSSWISASTIRSTSCVKVVLCAQPSTRRALLASPHRSSTSDGR